MPPEVVLVVEDEPLQCAAIEDVLTTAGFAVVACSDARQALTELNKRDDIAAVVTDIRMPGEFDGLIVAWRSAFRRKPVPVIVVSAFVRSGSEPGSAFRFLPKPVNLDQLVREVKEAISRSRQQMPPDNKPTRRRRHRVRA